MKLKNNIKLLNFQNQYKIEYSLNNFFELDLFKPLTQKIIFLNMILIFLKTKNLERMSLEWEVPL